MMGSEINMAETPRHDNWTNSLKGVEKCTT
jgi:hypothetical protein